MPTPVGPRRRILLFSISTGGLFAIAARKLTRYSFVVVVNSDRKYFFCHFLTYYVKVQIGLDFVRAIDSRRLFLALPDLLDYPVAKVDALVANIDVYPPSDDFSNLAFGFAAKGARDVVAQISVRSLSG